jgi:hypothetical protein
MQGQMAPANAGAAQSAAPSAWGVYFPSDAYSPQDRRVQLIQELLTSLATDAGWQLLSSGLRTVQHLTACFVALDYEQLLQLCDSANLSAALEMQPTEGLLCLQAAVHEVGKACTRVQAAFFFGGLWRRPLCTHQHAAEATASIRRMVQPTAQHVACGASLCTEQHGLLLMLPHQGDGAELLFSWVLLQAVFVVHKTRSAVMLADMEAPSTVTVRLVNYTPSNLHLRQLKSSTIGVCQTCRHDCSWSFCCLPAEQVSCSAFASIPQAAHRPGPAQTLCTAPHPYQQLLLAADLAAVSLHAHCLLCMYCSSCRQAGHPERHSDAHESGASTHGGHGLHLQQVWLQHEGEPA